MYEASEAFHKQYSDMYDKFVKIHFKDGSVRVELLFEGGTPFLKGRQF